MSKIAPVEPAALVVDGPVGLDAALVDQDDDRLDALLLQLLATSVRRCRPRRRTSGPRRPLGGDDRRRALQRHADEADLHAVRSCLMRERAGRAVLRRRRRGRSPRGTGTSRRRTPCPSWQPSVGWQPPFCIRSSSARPSSNSWLPTAVTSRPERVHRLDGRLVVEERREQRGGADDVAGRDRQRSCSGVRSPRAPWSSAWRGTRPRPRPSSRSDRPSRAAAPGSRGSR